jgi:hypothetical protein
MGISRTRMLSDQSIAVSIALRDVFQNRGIGRSLHCLLVFHAPVFQCLLHGGDFEVERQRRDQLFGDRKK